MLQVETTGSGATPVTGFANGAMRCFMIAMLWAATMAHAQPAQPVRIGGMEMFHGVIPAEIILGHPQGHAERQMHGGVPKGAGQHHLLVSLFDSKSGQRIANAAVIAKVTEIGLGSQEKPLELMPFGGAITYGNYFRMSSPGPYRVDIEIRRPGLSVPVKTTFEYRHPRR